jgi:E1A-binding protein p400
MAAQAAAAQAAVNKKNKKKQSTGLKLSANTRPMKTSTLYAQDNNTAWSAMYANRFESIKAVANKRSPTTKPLVVNPSMKNSQHAIVLSEAGISYDSPLNPIQVAANRADRIQREKERTQQDQQQQLAQQRTAAAQAAAQAATSAAQQQTRIVTASIASPQQTIVQQQVQQQQQSQSQPQTQTVVTSSPHPQAVVVSISQPMASAQLNNVIQSRIQPQQQQLQQLRPTQQQTIGIQELVRVCAQQPTHSTVVVTSQPPSAVVSVASLTPSQYQAAQKLVGQTGTIKSGVVTAQGRALTQQQVNLLRQQQQALLKKTAQDNNAVVAAAQKARLQGMQIAGTSSAAATAGVTTGTITTSGAIMTPQKVTVTAVSLAPSNLVTVVTQSGHPKTFIRQVSMSIKLFFCLRY